MVMLWLFIVLVVIAAAAIIAVFIIDRRSGLGPSTGTPKRSELSWSRRGSEQVVELPRRLANSASLFQLPAVRKRIRAQRWLHALLAVLLVSGLVSAAAIAGRPVRVTERSDALANRDIVLCLDVSTSMVRIDSSVLTTFSEILEDFDGERVGIVAWNSAAQTIVPLTDDYELLRDQLSELGDVLDIDPENVTYKQQLAYQEAFGGTVNSSINGSSLAGDGLASCAQAFDNQGLERSRSIILATDNQVIDPDNEQIYPLPDAAWSVTMPSRPPAGPGGGAWPSSSSSCWRWRGRRSAAARRSASPTWRSTWWWTAPAPWPRRTTRARGPTASTSRPPPGSTACARTCGPSARPSRTRASPSSPWTTPRPGSCR